MVAEHTVTIAQLILQSDYYNTIGFTNMDNGQYDLKTTQTDIRIAMKLDADSNLVYEVAIPIRYVLGKDLLSGQDSKNFSVGITLMLPMSIPETGETRVVVITMETPWAVSTAWAAVTITIQTRQQHKSRKRAGILSGLLTGNQTNYCS